MSSIYRSYCNRRRVFSVSIALLTYAIIMFAPCVVRAGLVSVSPLEIAPATPAENCLTVVFFNAGASNSETQDSFERLIATLRRNNSPLIVVSPYERDENFQPSEASYHKLCKALCGEGELAEFGVDVSEREELRVIFCDVVVEEPSSTSAQPFFFTEVINSSRWSRIALFGNEVYPHASTRGVSPVARNEAADADVERADDEASAPSEMRAICSLQYVPSAFFFDLLQEAFTRARVNEIDSCVSVCGALNYIEKLTRETGDLDRRILTSYAAAEAGQVVSYPKRDWRLTDAAPVYLELSNPLKKRLLAYQDVESSKRNRAPVWLMVEYEVQGEKGLPFLYRGQLRWYEDILRSLGDKARQLVVRSESNFGVATQLPEDIDVSALTVVSMTQRSLVKPDRSGRFYLPFLVVETSSGDCFYLSANQLEDQQDVRFYVARQKRAREGRRVSAVDR